MSKYILPISCNYVLYNINLKIASQGEAIFKLIKGLNIYERR
jgi:hypothetical protein